MNFVKSGSVSAGGVKRGGEGELGGTLVVGLEREPRRRCMKGEGPKREGLVVTAVAMFLLLVEGRGSVLVVDGSDVMDDSWRRASSRPLRGLVGRCNESLSCAGGEGVPALNFLPTWRLSGMLSVRSRSPFILAASSSSIW